MTLIIIEKIHSTEKNCFKRLLEQGRRLKNFCVEINQPFKI